MENLMLQTREIWTGIALLCGSVMDVRSKKLPVWYMALFGCGSLAVILAADAADWQSKVTGLLLGGSILLLGKWSGCIGVADGVLVVILGFLYGGYECAFVLMIAVLFAAVMAIGLMSAHKATAKSRIPFVPFLAAGYIVFLLRGWMV